MQQCDPMMVALARLLNTSLAEWRIDGTADADAVCIAVHGDGVRITITRAPSGMPFRWVVLIDGRRRTAASVNGVLRIVRQTLALGYEPLSLRIAPLPEPPAKTSLRAMP